MTRAAPLPPDERRQALIAATQPLLLTHGTDITSRQIAEAAGVAEGTIFRVFDCKQDLLDAAIADLLSPDHLFGRLRAASDTGDLLALASELIAILQEHARGVRRLFSAVQNPPGQHPPGDHPRHHDHSELGRRTVDLLAELLAPHQPELKLPARSAAATLLALSFGSSFAPATGDRSPRPADVARILLYGISKEPEC